MPLSAGTALGAYEVVGPVGAGGMGEVYRARDTRLKRDVALKLLPDLFARDPERLARLAREAQMLAALNHPNIAQVYGFEESGSGSFLVMEFVDGPTLADRVGAGRLPVADALTMAIQIAAALETAHDKGIIHRDLKPANIKVNEAGIVKVLDFGIAKTTAPVPAADAATIEATREGTVIGTAAYMSPEQARGQAVDTRADIWAFGAVLYELLTGRPAFGAGTAQDELAAVLTRDPDWAAIPAPVPAGVVRLIRRCMQRDLSRRLRHIGDARLELEEIRAAAGGEESVRPASRVRAWMLPAALLAGAVLALAVRAFVVSPADAVRDVHATVFGVNEPPGESLYLFAGPVALSPDGTRVALVTNGRGGKPRIWLRSLSAAAPVPLDGAEGGINPFWSPDGRSLAFFSGSQLSVIDLASHAVRPIAPWKGPLAGGSWSRDGVVLFADTTGLKRVPATGGAVQEVTKSGSTGEPGVFHAAPYFLPDGRHYLYLVGNSQTGQGTVMLGTLDAPETSAILSGTTSAIYARPGYLIYVMGGNLVAQRFNTTRLALEGDPQVLAEGAWAWSAGGMIAASASETGLLMFAARRSVTTQLTWIDRSGRPVGTLGEPAEWVHIDASPDERMIVAERMDARSGVGKIWTIDVARNVPSLLTPEPEWRLAPVWSPDGSRVVFGASRNGASNLFMRPADGGAETPLYMSADLKVPTDWTRDGQVIFNDMSGAGSDIVSLPVSGQGSAVPLVKGAANEGSGKVSPNGRWLAYVSNESGRPEIYVRDRAGTRRWQISKTGGSQPRWRRDGAELFYLSADLDLTVTRVSAGDNFSAGEPQALPIKVQPHAAGWRYAYDVVNFGQRFLVNVPTAAETPSPVTAVMNWTAALKRP